MKPARRERIRAISFALGAGADLHLVGGCVRDQLLGESPHDIDLCTVLTPDKVEERLTKANIRHITTGIRRGTVTAIIDQETFEITTFRNPENEKQFVQDIETDLAARDFTINAIAMNVVTETIVDPFNGRQDLRNDLVRCVGDPNKRFREDPHRILRMARFAWGAQRIVCPETEKAAEELSHLIINVAPERVHDELIKIVCTKFPDRALDGLQRAGALRIILPELEACVGIVQNKHHTLDVFNHIIQTVANIRNDKILRLAAMFHDIAKPITLTTDEKGDNHFYGHEHEGVIMTTNIMERLRFSNNDIQNVTRLIDKHGLDTNCGDAGVRRLLRNFGEEGALQLIELKQADGLAGHVNDRAEELQDFLLRVKEQIEFAKNNPFIKLAIDGNDIMNLGVPKGKEVGRLLQLVREAVLEVPEDNNREFLLELVKKEL